MAKKKQRESPSGFHYINLYQCCQRRWYMLYIKKWRPATIAFPLVQGAAFHLAKALWYQRKTEAACVKAAHDYIDLMRSDIAEEDYTCIKGRITPMIEVWIDRCGRLDREEFNVIAVEKELKVPVGDRFVMTIRPDAVLQHKQTGLVYVIETKTSGFSKRVTEEGVRYGDQATAYLWGVKTVLGIDAAGVIPDILYWNKLVRDTSKIECYRGEIVQRSGYALELFEKNMLQLFQEATQKVLAYKQGYDPDVLFARNSYYCMSYFHPCPYASVCMQDVQKMKKPPTGFVKEAGKRALGDMCWDSLGV